MNVHAIFPPNTEIIYLFDLCTVGRTSALCSFFCCGWEHWSGNIITHGEILTSLRQITQPVLRSPPLFSTLRAFRVTSDTNTTREESRNVIKSALPVMWSTFRSRGQRSGYVVNVPVTWSTFRSAGHLECRLSMLSMTNDATSTSWKATRHGGSIPSTRRVILRLTV